MAKDCIEWSEYAKIEIIIKKYLEEHNIVGDVKFIDLIDTPDEYVNENLFVRINDDGDGLIFHSIPSGTYKTTLPGDPRVPEDIGGIDKDTLASELDGKTNSEMWDEILFKTMFATKTDDKDVTLNSIMSGYVEVGTSISGTLTATYNHGEITDGDGVTTSEIGDSSTKFVFIDYDDNTITKNVTDIDVQSTPITTKVLSGSHRCKVILTHLPGTKSYLDSKGHVYTDTNLDDLIAETEEIGYSNYYYGRYKILQGFFNNASDPITTGTGSAERLDVNLFHNKVWGLNGSVLSSLSFLDTQYKFVVAFPKSFGDVTKIVLTQGGTPIEIQNNPSMSKFEKEYDMPDGKVTYNVYSYTVANPLVTGTPIKVFL